MKNKHFHLLSKRGVALVTTLAMVFIISALVISFFTMMRYDYQSSFSYSQQIKTEELARGALASVVSQLQEEIKTGSTFNDPSSQDYIIEAKQPEMVNPARFLSNGELNAAGDPFANLIRKSASNSLSWQPSYYANYNDTSTGNKFLTELTASQMPTDQESLNGRAIANSRWNKPQLLDESAVDSSAFSTPDWIAITRSGPATIGSSDLPSAGNSDLSNPNYVTGRFAYQIYDVSGLPDANIVGYPTSFNNNSDITRKGPSVFADLTKIPNDPNEASPSAFLGAGEIDNFVNWKTSQTSTSSMFLSTVMTGWLPSGFLMNTDTNGQRFLSRQDLLNYAEQNNFTDSMRFFTTFSREVNAPTWTPSYNASDLGGSGTQFNYRSNADSPTAINRNFNTVRVKAPFTRNDGTTAQVDEPLVKRRFDLSLLNLVASTASHGGAAENYFGLQAPSNGLIGSWQYNPTGGSNSTILTLEQVANLSGSNAREPNFIELLKATILHGSLGKNPGQWGSGQHAVDTEGVQGDVYTPYGNGNQEIARDYHIIQLAANIIDQADDDNYPTTIIYDGLEFYGIEDLPYFARIFDIIYTQSETPRIHRGIIQPELWNPHQQAPGPRPSEIRVVADGPLIFRKSGNPLGGFVDFNINNTTQTNSDALVLSGYGTNSFRGAPEVLTPNNANSANPLHYVSGIANPFVGFSTNEFFPTAALSVVGWTETQFSANFTLALQWRRAGGTWRTYSKMENLRSHLVSNLNNASTSITNSANGGRLVFYQRPDPRTDRFSNVGSFITLRNQSGQQQANDIGTTLRMGTGAGFENFSHSYRQSAGFFGGYYNGRRRYLPGLLSDNDPAHGVYYTDPDNVVRKADGAFNNGNDFSGYPIIPNNPTSSPIILNRPFRSVGELGYVYRDLPFKHIDFWTPESADFGLLDVFTVQGRNNSSITAGRINLNTPHTAVLDALLSGTLKTENGSNLLNSESDNIAQAVVTSTSNTPLTNRSELASRLTSILSSELLPTDQKIKTHRDSALRALTDAGQSRTWNIMIDLIAQSGSYSQNATSINSFNVSGERRYWMHVAIDRFTGEVIDSELEQVYE